jgi:hypothetical protein
LHAFSRLLLRQFRVLVACLVLAVCAEPALAESAPVVEIAAAQIQPSAARAKAISARLAAQSGVATAPVERDGTPAAQEVAQVSNGRQPGERRRLYLLHCSLLR